MAAIRSQSASAEAGIERAQVDRGDLRVRCSRVDERQGHGPVEQVGAARLAGPLRRARRRRGRRRAAGRRGRSRPRRRRAASSSRPHPAGALEQRRGLQPAALEVALLARSRCRRRPGAGRAPPSASATEAAGEQLDRARVPRLGEQREGARKEQVADRGGAVAARLGDDGRAAAAQVGIVEDVVVDQGRHVDQLDRGGAADLRLPPGSPAQSRASIGRSRLPPASSVASASAPSGPAVDGLPAEEFLDLPEPGRQPAAGRVEHRRHRRRNCRGAASLANAAVDRDDPSGEDRVADLAEAGGVHLRRQARAGRESVDRLGADRCRRRGRR